MMLPTLEAEVRSNIYRITKLKKNISKFTIQMLLIKGSAGLDLLKFVTKNYTYLKNLHPNTRNEDPVLLFRLAK